MSKAALWMITGAGQIGEQIVGDAGEQRLVGQEPSVRPWTRTASGWLFARPGDVVQVVAGEAAVLHLDAADLDDPVAGVREAGGPGVEENLPHGRRSWRRAAAAPDQRAGEDHRKAQPLPHRHAQGGSRGRSGSRKNSAAKRNAPYPTEKRADLAPGRLAAGGLGARPPGTTTAARRAVRPLAQRTGTDLRGVARQVRTRLREHHGPGQARVGGPPHNSPLMKLPTRPDASPDRHAGRDQVRTSRNGGRRRRAKSAIAASTPSMPPWDMPPFQTAKISSGFAA